MFTTIRTQTTAPDYAYVYVDDRFAGWVRKHGTEWSSYLPDGTFVDGESTRDGAINEVAAHAGRNTR